MRSTLGLAMGGAALVMSATVVGLHQANTDLPFRDDYLGHSLTVAAGSALYAVLGAVIVWRRPRHPIGLLLLGIGLAAGFAAACREYALAGADGGALLPGASWAWWVGSFLWFPGYAIGATLLLVIFPSGRPMSPAWWPVAVAAGLLIIADTAWFAFTPFDTDLPAALGSLSHPLGLSGEPQRFEDVFTPLPLVYLAVTLACLAALAHRVVRSTGVARLQVGWFAIGSVLWVAAAITDAVVHYSERWVWAELIFIGLPALGATIGIVRYDLYDIRRVVHRGSVLVIFAAIATGIYAAVVVLGEYWFGRSRDDVWASSMAIALIAASALPLLRWMDRSAGRLLYGDTADPLAVLARLSGELNAAREPATALARAAVSIATSLRVPYVRIDADELDLVETGTPSTASEVFALLDRGVPVGTLTLGRRAVGEPFRADERQLLEDLAVRLGATASAVRAAVEIASSREQLVLAREEERRRIRHDLHDGLGPQLAGIGLQLDLGRELLDRDPTRVAGMLARAKDELDAALVGVRDVVDGLRPAGARRARTCGRHPPAGVDPRCQRHQWAHRDRPRRRPRTVAGGVRGGRLPDRDRSGQ